MPRPTESAALKNNQAGPSHLAARLGPFDATMVVMGGIIGSGIFINPYVVAKLVHTPTLILGAWISGGVLALIGAFVYAELADRMPEVGGQYAYLREAYHPIAGFLYGWAELFVIGAGGTAAVAVTFAKYFRELTQTTISETVIAVASVVLLIVINCLGVRAGSGVQSVFMVCRIIGVALVVACGAWFIWGHSSLRPAWHPILDRPASFDLLTVFGATMIPVMFAYGGWQTANYIASEIREPRKNLPRALLVGVLGVIALYVSVNFVYVFVLSPVGLAGTTTPASEVMRQALGTFGARLIAVAITISTLGFLSQAMLTYPRLYFAMAQDRVLPKTFAWLDPHSRVPVLAIVLQGGMTIAVMLLGTFEQILNYVVVMDWLFFGLSASCLFVLRARERKDFGSDSTKAADAYRVPGHPWTTALFVAAAWLIVVNTVYKHPKNTGIALCILFVGLPVYFILRKAAMRQSQMRDSR